MKIIALIDGDSIAYQAACADTENSMRHIVDLKMSFILVRTKADHYELYIEEWRKKKTNFRMQFDTEYKANRNKLTRPPFLKQAKDYMESRWGATSVDKFESEDMVIIRAHESSTMRPIICGIDKDLLQYPLEFFNYNAGVLFKLTEEEATLNLWRQVCTGDKACDNVPGLKGIGKVYAEKFIDNPETAMEDAAKLFIAKKMDYDYYIQQYNLIKLRHTRSTKKLTPLTKVQYEEIKDASI